MASYESGPTRALVLGGGGPVGVGWEIGLAAGLAEGGVQIADADFIVGTSAGSITGAKLALGDDVFDLYESSAQLLEDATKQGGADQVPAGALGGLMELMFRSADTDESPEQLRAEIGQFALEAETIAEDAWLSTHHYVFGDESWPEGYACTAVDAHTGAFVVWDQNSEVPLAPAIASSCTVPGIYPPATINGRRYIDGGMRSGLNADLAAGHDAAVVVSCMPLELPPGFDDPRIQRFFQRERDGIDQLRDSGAAVEVIAPDEEFLNISGFGMFLMDFTRVQQAAEAGRRLGKQEADRIRASWEL